MIYSEPSSTGVPASTTDAATPQHIRPFRTIIRGHAFASTPPDTDSVAVGTAVRLVREPANPADALAIAVWAASETQWRLGYLDRSVAAWLAPKLDAGVDISGTCTGWVAEPNGRWQRPVVLLRRSDEPRDARHDLHVSHRREPSWAAEDGRPYLWGRLPGVTRRSVA